MMSTGQAVAEESPKGAQLPLSSSSFLLCCKPIALLSHNGGEGFLVRPAQDKPGSAFTNLLGVSYPGQVDHHY